MILFEAISAGYSLRLVAAMLIACSLDAHKTSGTTGSLNGDAGKVGLL